MASDERRRLLVGLGNPGAQYHQTRHNAGFTFAHFLLDHFGLKKERDLFGSPLYELDSTNLWLLQPMTYMNCSGGPVAAACHKLELDDPATILVMHDEIDIPLADIRYKVGGGHGGHNGLRSIIDAILTNDFHRLRLGVGRPAEGVNVHDHVLGHFEPKEEEAFMTALSEKALSLVSERFLV